MSLKQHKKNGDEVQMQRDMHSDRMRRLSSLEGAGLGAMLVAMGKAVFWRT
jgi:hypothetical protein